MNQAATISTTEVSFKDFLFKNKRNRTILILVAAAIVIQFAVFKYFYPFANYIHGDSFSYINAADKNLDINTYLIGYSKFLRLFSVFNRTDYILTTFQYLFIEFSALYLLFTIFYFYNPRKFTQVALLCFMVFNPLFWHLGNLISSDGLFLAFSLTWVTLLIWIIHQPSLKIILWHAIILFIAFTIRYNAMIYPAIATIAFVISQMSLRRKILGMSLAVILISSFIGFTMYKYKKLTGYWQYSPFSGWQLSNNAMYAYRYVSSKERKSVPDKFRILNYMVCNFFDSTRNTIKYPTEAKMASTYYMWSPGMPLMKYRNSLFKNDTLAKELKKWASMGPFYKEYGMTIIKNYPWHFLKYFIMPNAIKYYAPPIEFLENYNSARKSITAQTQHWFGYNNRELRTNLKNDKVWILNYFSILSGIINLVMICCLLSCLILKSWFYQTSLRHAVIIWGTIWLMNAIFTIGASSAALRFQAFPIILTTTCVMLLINWLVDIMDFMKEEKRSKFNREVITDALRPAITQ